MLKIFCCYFKVFLRFNFQKGEKKRLQLILWFIWLIMFDIRQDLFCIKEIVLLHTVWYYNLSLFIVFSLCSTLSEYAINTLYIFLTNSSSILGYWILVQISKGRDTVTGPSRSRWWLDSMILKVFSNLDGSVIVWNTEASSVVSVLSQIKYVVK